MSEISISSSGMDALYTATFANTPSYVDLSGRRLEGARVLDVIDGDTLVVAARFTDGVRRVTVRVAGIDTPERTSKDDGVRLRAWGAHARALAYVCGMHSRALSTNASEDAMLSLCSQNRAQTRAAVRAFLQEHMAIVDVICGKQDKYGRTLADVVRTGEASDLAACLLSEGLAVAYHGGTKV